MIWSVCYTAIGKPELVLEVDVTSLVDCAAAAAEHCQRALVWHELDVLLGECWAAKSSYGIYQASGFEVPSCS